MDNRMDRLKPAKPIVNAPRYIPLQSGRGISQIAAALIHRQTQPLQATLAFLQVRQLTQEHVLLQEIVDRASAKGMVPFAQNQLASLVELFKNGRFSPPESGWWKVVTDKWALGQFSLQMSQGVSGISFVSYNPEMHVPYGREHNFIFANVPIQ
jgi:hypothetical protein